MAILSRKLEAGSWKVRAILAALLLLVSVIEARGARVKELADVAGFRPNQLVGMGLVVGLAGTGDDASSVVTRRELAAMTKRLGLAIDPADIKAKNIAAVTVTAELPPFARPGMSIDVTVSSMGSAKSLAGGTLLLTPLKGVDLGTYALAQGPLTVGGFAAEGGSGSSAKKNHVTVARVPSGARVEKEAPGVLARDEVVLMLRQPDFTTASRIAAAVNAALGDGAARLRDPGAVVVPVSARWKGKVVDLVAQLEALEAAPDAPARVVIDERTGTIVVGQAVTLGPAAIAVGGITVEVKETPLVSQPGILARAGETVVTPQSELKVEEAPGDVKVLPAATTVADVARALNALGAKPRDLAAIFQALKDAWALRAELVVR
jgi:flagellar P-ring protein precursor FlgI